MPIEDMVLMVAGPEDWDDYKRVKEVLNKAVAPFDEVTLVLSDGYNGKNLTEKNAAWWSSKLYIKKLCFYHDGYPARPNEKQIRKRDGEMLDEATALILFMHGPDHQLAWSDLRLTWLEAEAERIRIKRKVIRV